MILKLLKISLVDYMLVLILEFSLQYFSLNKKIDVSQYCDSIYDVIMNTSATIYYVCMIPKDTDNSDTRALFVFTNLHQINNDGSSIIRMVYDALYEHLDGPSIATCVLIVAKYQYQSAFVADHEINLRAALTEIMCECKFK